MEKVKKRDKSYRQKAITTPDTGTAATPFPGFLSSLLLHPLMPYLLFASFCFFYFLFFSSHVLWYQEKDSLFVLTADFLWESLREPGGLIVWLERLMVSFFLFPVSGALILSFVITLVIWLSERVTIISGSKPLKTVSFLCGIFLFYLHTDYRFSAMNSLGLLLQLVFFVSLARFEKGWAAVLLTPLVYYITGGFAWVYTLMISVYVLSREKGSHFLKAALSWILPGMFIILGAEFVFFREIKTLLVFPLTELNPGSHIYILTGIMALLALLPASSYLAVPQFRFPGKNRVATSIASLLLLLLILCVAGFLGYDGKTAKYFHAEKLFSRKQYGELIAYNTIHRPTNSLTVFLNNIALCETGQLNDRLLDFQQKADGSTLFLKWEMTGEILRRGAYFYYTTGMINEAHRWAYENMVISGPSPGDLELLIRTELVNGNYPMASKYIELLGKSLFYRKEARQFRKFLHNDDAIAGDPDLGGKRRIRLKSDFFSITDDPWINIRRVLDLDSLNRPAFDYNMAYLLLNKQYDLIAGQLPRFAEFGYRKLPVNVEEAAVAMALMNNNVMPDLGILSVSPSTQERWLRYLTVFQQYGSNPAAAEPALRKDFGNTYWYHAFYR